jgi:hypothetical protein
MGIEKTRAKEILKCTVPTKKERKKEKTYASYFHPLFCK